MKYFRKCPKSINPNPFTEGLFYICPGKNLPSKGDKFPKEMKHSLVSFAILKVFCPPFSSFPVFQFLI